MSDSDSDKGASSSTNPAITYTRTRKTKTAASSTRRRNNIPLCHSTGGGDGTADTATGSDKSWFSRKASGWTDDEIRSHLVSGASKGGGSLSMEGDLIQGGNSSNGRKKKNRDKRRAGPIFAWGEEEKEEGEDYHLVPMNGPDKSAIMRAAPTLQDIMDEQDQIDLLAPQKLGKDYQPSGSGDSNNGYTRPNRQTNAALAEIAQFYENTDAKIGTTAPTSTTTDSIGWRLLRVLGYRSRLGMVFVSLPGFNAANDDKDQAYDLESMHMTNNNLSAKHLASKGLRAIRLPSIPQNTSTNEKVKESDSHSFNKTLVIPPPKMNKHGIGYDPFKNAPEFRAFHEKRRGLAQKRGRAPDKSSDSRSTAYFTDNLRRDERQSLWDKKRDDDNAKSESNQRSDGQRDGQHMNYAAQDYTDFIGTKASSGFALEDEDDANVYQDDELDTDGFPTSSKSRGGYNLEVQSPVASEDEDGNNDGGLFHDSTASRRFRSSARKSKEGETNVAGAWDAWGMGVGDAAKSLNSDGKPPLKGFELGQQKDSGNSIKRWSGPMVPSGYVLQRHTFPAKDSVEASSAYTVNTSDCGLGLDLQYRIRRQSSRSSVPTVLPHSERRQQSEMRARDGTELNFNAVRESMKNRFVSSSNGNAAPEKTNIEEDTKDDVEWINVSSTSWMPSRLLCKRWGIPLPSDAATTPTNVSAAAGRVTTTGEEAYFNETVLLKQKGDEGKAGSIIGTKSKNAEEEKYMLDAVSADTDVPPPHRPSYDVFKAIFDAGSDMEISSSEDEDDKVQDVVEEVHTSSNAISNKPTQEQVATRSGSSSSDSEDSYQSRKRRHRRDDRHRRKRKHRRSRSPSNSPDIREYSDNSTDEHDKKRKKKKKRRRHKLSHSRHKEKRRR